jgi:DNA polymerase I-like protein with 3'-5' exonuclease and polymerase domains
METAYELSVPLSTEVQAGDNWDDMVPLALAVRA